MSHNLCSLLITIGAVAFMVFLAGLFLLILTAMNNEFSANRGEVIIQVYWQEGVDKKVLNEQWKQLKFLPGLIKLNTYTQDQALETLLGHIGQSNKVEISGLMAINPLPPTAVLHFMPTDESYTTWLKDTENFLKTLPHTDKVIINQLREDIARTWKAVRQQIMLPTIIFLAFILCLIVGNTLRLTLIKKATEIEILQLIGAANWYIRVPILIEGTFLGFLGASLGLLLLYLIYHYLAVNYFSPLIIQLEFISSQNCYLLLIIPSLIGMITSWFAVKHPLNKNKRK